MEELLEAENSIKEEILVSQATMARISEIAVSNISRYISLNSIEGAENTVGGKRKRYNFSTTRNILSKLSSNNVKIEKKTHVFFNFKGGTGKTTVSYQVAYMLAQLGFKVLAVDCDAQAHLTNVFGFMSEYNYMTLFDVFINRIPLKSVIKNIQPGLDLVPSNLSMSRIDIELSHIAGREMAMKKALEAVEQDYDFIIIDTNPTISNINRSAKYAANRLNIVCETQPFSIQSLGVVIKEIESFTESMNMEKGIEYKIIPNKYETKVVTSQQVLGQLRHDYGDKVMSSLIRKSEDLNISAKRKIPIYALAKNDSAALEDITDIVQEIIKDSKA